MSNRPLIAPASTCFRCSILTATGAANSKPIRCSRPTTSFCTRCSKAAIPERLKRAFTEMMRYQNDDGSWSIYPGGPGNISLSVKCYFSAKLMGIGPDDPRLAKCREWVLAHGGVVACNTFTKMYLCALGQYDYDAVPAIPPEIVLFPNWFYFNIYEISSWSRSILVPLAIIYAKKPYKKIPPEQGIDELFVGGRANSILRLRRDRKQLISWRNFFHRARPDDALGRGGSHPAAAHARAAARRRSGCWSAWR